ncbi:MAG: ABC transporter ATP-binding protein [Sandaracinaceae bacterium]|nr:ABC transporter ATP-binding protein [Sandaracinaceae bacterium]
MEKPATSNPPLLRVRQLRKRFLHEGREIEVLRGIDLEVHSGEMVAIVGASGAGKSTLLYLLGTLDLPTSGSIEYEGRDVTRYSNAELSAFRNQMLGFVFQFHYLLPEFTALENVMMPGLVGALPKKVLRERAKHLLEEVGLADRMHHRPGELSGGEQQRVALARALIVEPKLVLADEPTGNLDSKNSHAMQELFFELNQRKGTTFLIVTHSQELAARMPRIISMRDGRILSDERKEKEGALPHIQSLLVAPPLPHPSSHALIAEEERGGDGEQSP